MTTRRPTETGHFKASDGTRLFFEDDVVDGPRAALLLVHGFGDHCGRYAGLVDHLCGLGYSCYRFDYRGHGRAEGRRGHVFSFDDYLADLAAFRAHVAARIPAELPRFLLAHSNGALIAAHGVARDPGGLAGLCLSSPFFGLALSVPAWKTFLGRGLSRLIPALSLPTDLDPATVSHDPAVVAGYAEDPLVGRVATARWFTETTAAQAALPQVAARLQLPIQIQQAGDDRIASAAASEAFFGQLASTDKTFKRYPGLFHEIWFEHDREPVLADLGAWLAGHLPDAAA